MVLGLDFISSVGMIINVADKAYSFKCNPSVTYPFQSGSAHLPWNSDHEGKSHTQMTKSNQVRNLSLISSQECAGHLPKTSGESLGWPAGRDLSSLSR